MSRRLFNGFDENWQHFCRLLRIILNTLCLQGLPMVCAANCRSFGEPTLHCIFAFRLSTLNQVLSLFIPSDLAFNQMSQVYIHKGSHNGQCEAYTSSVENGIYTVMFYPHIFGCISANRLWYVGSWKDVNTILLFRNAGCTGLFLHAWGDMHNHEGDFLTLVVANHHCPCQPGQKHLHTFHPCVPSFPHTTLPLSPSSSHTEVLMCERGWTHWLFYGQHVEGIWTLY